MKSPKRFRGIFGPGLLTTVLSSTALAQFQGLPTGANPGKIRLGGDVINNVLIPRSGNSITIAPGIPPVNLGTFDIVINPGPGLLGNIPALNAFNRAAASWEARISDPITITVDANIDLLPPGVLGSTGAVVLFGDYNDVRGAIVLDAADEPSNGIVASLPLANQFFGVVPNPTTTPGHGAVGFTGDIAATKANYKALGIPGLDTTFGVTDGQITFSTSFNFDYDNSDGVTPGFIDFETVAAHEIGHALGFISIVDTLNTQTMGQAGFIPFFPLDLFRFATSPVNIPNGGQVVLNPSTAAEFTTTPRNFLPGATAITDEINGPNPELLMSTGTLDLAFNFLGRDGNQASHWKADELTGNLIGLMDPTLASGQFYGPQNADFRALDLIGYEVIPVPEPAGVGVALGLIGLVGWRVLRKS